MWDWKLAEFDSFARHVELIEFQTQVSLNSRAMGRETVTRRSWRRAAATKVPDDFQLNRANQ